MNYDDLNEYRYKVHMMNSGDKKDKAVNALELVESAFALSRGADASRRAVWSKKLAERRQKLDSILRRC